MTTEELTQLPYVLVNVNENDQGAIVKGANWNVKTQYGKDGRVIARGWTPFDAWCKAYMVSGALRADADAAALIKCGCNPKTF